MVRDTYFEALKETDDTATGELQTLICLSAAIPCPTFGWWPKQLLELKKNYTSIVLHEVIVALNYLLHVAGCENTNSLLIKVSYSFSVAQDCSCILPRMFIALVWPHFVIFSAQLQAALMLLQVVLHESSPLNKNRLYRLRALCDPVMIKIELIGLVVFVIAFFLPCSVPQQTCW